MTDKNPLLNKLLEEKQKGSDAKKMEKSTPALQGAHTQKIINLRYKIYAVIVLIVLWMVRTRFLSPTMDKKSSVEASLTAGESRVVGMTRKLRDYQQDQKYVDSIENNNDAIKNCVNFDRGCETLSADIISNLAVVKAYLQIGNLYDKKMVIDEKSLLMNLDAFMTKRWNETGSPTTANNGTIEELIIGDPKQISEQLYQVPVDIVVEFPDSKDLLSFISNTEDRIIIDINTELFKSTPVLYRIQELAYDIVKYEESQAVQIKMIAYYYEEKGVTITADDEEEKETEE